jgi:hypothetical protein
MSVKVRHGLFLQKLIEPISLMKIKNLFRFIKLIVYKYDLN